MAGEATIGNRIAPPRLILFFAVLIVAGGLAAAWLSRAAAVMAAFDLAAAIFLIGCLPLFRREADEMRKSARDNDANRVIMLVLTVVLTLVILVTVAGELISGKPTEMEKILVIATLALAWTFANMVYALHYAHLYYTRDDGGKDLAGLDFPGERPEPDYSDFVYFSFTLGVALQTSDVGITSSGIRRVVIGHCVAAFIYNLGVLALAVSVLGAR